MDKPRLLPLHLRESQHIGENRVDGGPAVNLHPSPAQNGPFGPSPRLFRSPYFFQRLMEATMVGCMALLLPSMLGRPLIFGALLLGGFALILTPVVLLPKLQQRPGLLMAITLGGCTLTSLAVPQVSGYVNSLHMLLFAVLVWSAPFLRWPQALSAALVMEALYVGAKFGWAPTREVFINATFLLDTLALLLLATASKNWHELNQAVRRSAVELSAVTGSSGDLIVILDRSGAVRSINMASRALLGYGPEEIVGREAVHALGQLGEARQIGELLNAGQPAYSIMKQARHKNGSDVWLEWNVEPIPELDAILCIGRDVSRRNPLTTS